MAPARPHGVVQRRQVQPLHVQPHCTSSHTARPATLHERCGSVAAACPGPPSSAERSAGPASAPGLARSAGRPPQGPLGRHRSASRLEGQETARVSACLQTPEQANLATPARQVPQARRGSSQALRPPRPPAPGRPDPERLLPAQAPRGARPARSPDGPTARRRRRAWPGGAPRRSGTGARPTGSRGIPGAGGSLSTAGRSPRVRNTAGWEPLELQQLARSAASRPP